MIELSVIRDLVGIFGVIAGFTYYVLTVRNAQRNQQHQLETRQAQLFMQIYDNFNKTEFYRKFMEVVQLMEWNDVEDYDIKYGDVLEDHSKTSSLGVFFEGIGVLAQQELIDVKLVARLMSSNLRAYWEKTGPIWKARRERSGNPYIMEYNEWLYNAVKRVKQEQKPAYLME